MIPEIEPNVTETVHQPYLFGIGHNVEITVTVEDSFKTATANWILGPLVIGVTNLI